MCSVIIRNSGWLIASEGWLEMRHGDDGENENQTPLGQIRPGCSVLGPARLSQFESAVCRGNYKIFLSSSLPIVGSLKLPNKKRLLTNNILILKCWLCSRVDICNLWPTGPTTWFCKESCIRT